MQDLSRIAALMGKKRSESSADTIRNSRFCYIDPISHVFISLWPSVLAALLCLKFNAPMGVGIGIFLVYYSFHAFLVSLIGGLHGARVTGIFLLLVGTLIIIIHYLVLFFDFLHPRRGNA